MLLQVIVWGLPIETEERLKMLYYVLVRNVREITEMCVTDEKDVMVNFPKDEMAHGLGADIIVQISGIDKELGLKPHIRKQLARSLGGVLTSWYPEAIVDVRPDPDVEKVKDGYWSSRKPVLNTEGIRAMLPSEFFTRERLATITDDPKMLTRLKPVIESLLQYDPVERETVSFANMAEFLHRYPRQSIFERAPNCGKIGANIIGEAMRREGFEIAES